MGDDKRVLQKLRKEFLKFMIVMEELRLLKNVSEDLKSFRRMMRLKKYD